MTYRFTLCEYGGGEVASCELRCDEDFADGFERATTTHIDQETHYIVREEIGEEDPSSCVAKLNPWKRVA